MFFNRPTDQQESKDAVEKYKEQTEEARERNRRDSYNADLEALGMN